MPLNSAEVRVHGLRDLQRALNKVDRDTAKLVRDGLKEVAEPVRADAESLAVARIRTVGTTWSRMRVGTSPGTVYVAPKARSRGGSPRPNFGGLLLQRAMLPALEKNEERIEAQVADAFDRIADRAGF